MRVCKTSFEKVQTSGPVLFYVSSHVKHFDETVPDLPPNTVAGFASSDASKHFRRKATIVYLSRENPVMSHEAMYDTRELAPEAVVHKCPMHPRSGKDGLVDALVNSGFLLGAWEEF